ncbi:RelA/SpoT domain-containing protein [Rhodanobacter sp. B2A1Ga4]|uniref:RelA/SpoT domain-containing protein n=1 Tax=Rhodanobacter sp. B2A1Ga4 TaxID=2778647 RepID=UPI001B391A2F|nr:RelA/SpoT domain-containing protein [Rhodanobacter sp. B2A1Ga4]MBQ4853928.1 RelA/SpoT domain-containing protein [Rhodanobacter sp. B2A1Ga4]
MVWARPEFSRGAVRRAGHLIATPYLPDESYFNDPTAWAEYWEHSEGAFRVFENWRAAHAYPLNTFQVTLRGRAQRIDAQALTAQRLKRAPSIIAKLQRFEKMKLDRMQDIGGCRAVMKDLASVYKLRRAFDEAHVEHEQEAPKDYIENPKDDGYRSIHLIFRYHGKGEKSVYDGLRIEVQLRTQIQHAWATAVETVGLFRREAIKSGEGDQRWRDFFLRASQAFAILEKHTRLRGLVLNHDLFDAVRESADELDVVNRLRGYQQALTLVGQRQDATSYLLELDLSEQRLTVSGFSRHQVSLAQSEYARAEKKLGSSGDVVLVAAGSAKALKKAYPNYFADTSLFLKTLNRIMERY